MAKKTKKKVKTQMSSGLVLSLVIGGSVAFILLLYLVSKAISLVVNPMWFFIGFGVIGGYLIPVWYLGMLSTFRNKSMGASRFIPVYNEIVGLRKGPIKVLMTITFLIFLITGILFVLGSMVPMFSIPSLIVDLQYRTSGVMNNGNLLLYNYILLAVVVIFYLLFNTFRAVAYVTVDAWVTAKEQEFYKLERSRKRQGGQAKTKSALEYVAIPVLFLPVVRVLAVFISGQRLQKLVIFHAMRQNTKTIRTNVIEEDDEDYEY